MSLFPDYENEEVRKFVDKYKYDRDLRSWLRRKKNAIYADKIVLKTDGVWRYEPLLIDLYPTKNWARNYKTGEAMYFFEALDKIITHIKGV